SAFEQIGGGKDLDAVADGEDPFAEAREFLGERDQFFVVAQVFGGSAAHDQDGVEILGAGFGDGEVGGTAVAGLFDVGIPAWLEIVDDEVDTAFRWRGDQGLMAFFAEAMEGVEGFVGFAAVSGDDENFAHGRILCHLLFGTATAFRAAQVYREIMITLAFIWIPYLPLRQLKEKSAMQAVQLALL